MDPRFDLDGYLGRIGWNGPRQPSLDVLCGVLRAHMGSIPFENLDVLLGRGVRLDMEGLQDKLVRRGRGGYCFEHATLMHAALQELGFQPSRHSARVVVFSPRTSSPRAHMFLAVPVAEGTFIVDPGFGAFGPRVPLPLVEGAEVQNEGETHWLLRDGGYWMLRARVGGRTMDAWVTTLEEDHPVDFEMANHYTATHPASPFVNRLMLGAVTSEGRLSGLNRDVTMWTGDDSRVSHIADRAELRVMLARHFGFDLPEVDHLRVPTVPEWD